MWHYVQSEPRLWTVGHGEGKTWTPDSDHETRASAAARVAYLNGNGGLIAEKDATIAAQAARIAELEAQLVELEAATLRANQYNVVLEDHNRVLTERATYRQAAQ